MTDRDAFIRAICAAPADDLPRLVYADRLEELDGEVECGRCKGDGQWRYVGPHDCVDGTCPDCSGTGRVSNHFAERAEFIRVQCELAKCPDEREPGSYTVALRRRGQELLDRHWSEWIRGAGLVSDGWRLSTDGDSFHVWRNAPFDDGFRFRFRRGFVAEVRCTLGALFGERCRRCEGEGRVWLEHPESVSEECDDCHGGGRIGGVATGLFRNHPVKRVTLTDRDPNPARATRYAVWFANRGQDDVPNPADSNWLPWLIARRLGPSQREDYPWFERHTWYYASPADAMAALSAVCVEHGRELAGLSEVLTGA